MLSDSFVGVFFFWICVIFWCWCLCCVMFWVDGIDLEIIFLMMFVCLCYWLFCCFEDCGLGLLMVGDCCSWCVDCWSGLVCCWWFGLICCLLCWWWWFLEFVCKFYCFYCVWVGRMVGVVCVGCMCGIMFVFRWYIIYSELLSVMIISMSVNISDSMF